MSLKHAHIVFIIISIILGITGQAEALELRTFSFDGSERLFLIHNTAASREGPVPLVVVLHGVREPGEPIRGENQLAEAAWARLDALAEQDAFVTVYPAANGGRWNLSSESSQSEGTRADGTDDVSFISAVIKHLVAINVAAPTRLYLTGFSDGAIMSYKLLCHEEALFSAAALISGTMRQKDVDDCRSRDPVPVMLIAGTLDPILPYDGWIYPTGRELSVPETMEFWRRRQACSGRTQRLLRQHNTAHKTRARLISWNGCRQTNSIELYRIEGGGHQVPSYQPSPDRTTRNLGNRNHDIETGDVVWGFLRRFSKPN